MQLLVNIRGTNGAGKSTIPMSMLKDEKLEIIGVGSKVQRGKDVPTHPFLTVFHSFCWVALGTYHNKTGGMDTFQTTEMTKEALEYAWVHYPDYDILMEGIIASTIRSTYTNLFHDYRDRVKHRMINPRKILIVNFLPPLEVCLERVQQRNNGKAINELAVASKWRTVDRNADHFKSEGFDSIKVNNSKTKKEDMLMKFLNLCDKHREGK